MTEMYTNPVRQIPNPCARELSVPIMSSTDTFLYPVLVGLPSVLLLVQGAKPRTCRCMWLTRPAQSIQLARHHFVLTCSSVEKLLEPHLCGQIPSEEGCSNVPVGSATGSAGDEYISHITCRYIKAGSM